MIVATTCHSNSLRIYCNYNNNNNANNNNNTSTIIMVLYFGNLSVPASARLSN